MIRSQLQEKDKQTCKTQKKTKIWYTEEIKEEI